jgi:NAD-dependent DNA ligase
MTEIRFDPVKFIEFKGKIFCFTGTLDYGNRKQCKEAVQERRGIVINNVCKDTDYLVVGRDLNGDYTYRHKIKYAEELREQGVPIQIVKQENWVKHL